MFYSIAVCDESCLQRYLRARNMDVTKAHDMLAATLKWRQEHKVGEHSVWGPTTEHKATVPAAAAAASDLLS